MTNLPRCACPTIDRYDCILFRYPRITAAMICDDPIDDIDPEPCECACHDEWEDEGE